MDNSGQQYINNFSGQPQVAYNAIPGRAPQPEKKDRSGLIKTILLIFVSLIAATFVVLFIVMYVNWNEAKTDVDGKVKLAVAEAENTLQTKLESEFAEREKYPYYTFAGPTDFGSLTFEYPKTWSTYIPDDASQAKDFHAYLNPGQVYVVSDKTVMALRVSIVNKLTDNVKRDYIRDVERGKMTVSSTIVNGVNVDVYTGELKSKYQGIVCIFKIRDKTAIIQTDAMIFKDDFYRILETIRYNA
jgi:hypothetical protein